MTETRRLPHAIQWHEGMLLAPQHFQQLTARTEALLSYHIGAASPFQWGIQRFEFDRSLLVEGIFRILDLEAVMPDGLVIYHPAENAQDVEVNLTAHKEAMKHSPLTIYLAVPAARQGAAPVRGALARFDSIEGAAVVDENTGEAEMTIPRLVPRISLEVTDKLPGKFTGFPLVQIAYRNETFGLTDFVPPMLKVQRLSAIGKRCSAIAQRLREKAVFLSEKVNTADPATQGPLILETKLLIQSLVAELPHFEAMLNSGVSHPYPLYLALCSLAGHVAAVGFGLVPPVMDGYDHNNMAAGFAQAQSFIFQVMDQGIVESHKAVPFALEQGVFRLEIEADWTRDPLLIGARSAAGMTEKNTVHWFKESVIGSASFIEAMKKKRILGPARQKLEGPAPLVPSRGVVLFSVSPDPKFIRPGEVLEIVNPVAADNKGQPTEILLYVRNHP